MYRDFCLKENRENEACFPENARANLQVCLFIASSQCSTLYCSELSVYNLQIEIREVGLDNLGRDKIKIMFSILSHIDINHVVAGVVYPESNSLVKLQDIIYI